MKPRIGHVAAFALGLGAATAQAAYHTFVIDEVFSNADGSVQYVVLRENQGADSQNVFSGQSFTSVNAAGTMKTMTFGANLPTTFTASRSVLIATPGFAALGLVTPNYMVPARFVPADGGSLNFAGVDQLTLPQLPADGIMAVDRFGMPRPAMPRNFNNASAPMTAAPVANIEFYHRPLDHYFISSLAPDIDALDSGRLAGWARTGLGFRVFPSQAAGGAGASPVCRIRIPPEIGDSHFYSASPQECSETIAKFPAMTQESSNVFYIALPSTAGPNAGACPSGTIPVYRVFNNRADANHRYTSDRALRDQMVTMGGIKEGYGDDAVIMCAVPGAVDTAAADAFDSGLMMPPQSAFGAFMQ